MSNTNLAATAKPVKPFAVSTALRLLALYPNWYFFKIDPGTKNIGMPNDNLNTGATNDPKVIGRWPPNCNVGVALKKSGLIVADVDVKPGKVGAATLDMLELEHGPMPGTYTVRSGSGGPHYYYTATNTVKHVQGQNKFGKDIDCPGYVLIAGCQFDGKLYTTVPGATAKKLAPAPDWFAEYLQQRVESPSIGDNDAPAVDLDDADNIKRAIFYLQNDAPPSIEGSNGDKTLLMVAATLKDLGISEPEAVALIEEHYNVDGKCIPVWTSEECAKKVRNAWSYLKETQPGALGIKPAEDFAAEPILDDDAAEAAALDKMVAWWKSRDQAERQKKYDHRDFLLYLPGADKTKFIFTKTGSEEFWSASAVNLKCKPQPIIDKRKKGKKPDECEKIDGTRDQWLRKVGEDGKPVLDKDGKPMIAYQAAADWIKDTPEQHVAVVTWWPGKPPVIRNNLVIKEGGIVPTKGMHSFNRYRPPHLTINTPGDATMWLDHLKLIYPDDWQHIIYWLAWRVQHPEKKILHALVLGGATRIGKDRLLAPIAYAIGPWNFASTNAQTIMDEPKFTPYLESVVCLIHEAKDFGDQDRYAFYHRIKPWIGGEARGVLMSADKQVKVHAIIDVWAPIITTNFKLRGLYIPPDDARIYFAWSSVTRDDIAAKYKTTEAKLDTDYFKPLQRWYESGGYEAVAHYLRTLDLTKADFSPTAPPPKTDAWREVVAAGRDHAESTLERIIEDMGNPAAVSVNEVRAADDEAELDWWTPKGRNQVAPQMETAGYVRVSNPGNKSGRWTVGRSDDRREIMIYAQAKLTPAERRKAALEVFDRAAEQAKKASEVI